MLNNPLRDKNFLKLWVGLCFSLLSTGIWSVTLPLISLRQGYPVTTLGIILACGFIGTLVSLLFGGVLIDRVQKRKALTISSAIPAATLLFLFAVSYSGDLPAALIGVGAFIVGACDGIYGPANESILPEIIEHNHLHVANSLQAIVESLLLKACGPAIGGMTLAIFGVKETLAVTGLLFCCVSLCTKGISSQYDPSSNHHRSGLLAILRNIGEGFTYVSKTRWLWTGILWSGLALLLQAGPRSVALPVIFGADNANKYALLMVLYGIASAVGALVAPLVPEPQDKLAALFGAWSLGSIPLVAIAIHPSVIVAAIALSMVGVFNTYGNILWQTLMQSGVPQALRGRVTSLDWFGSISLMPVSTILAGVFIDHGYVSTLFYLASFVPIFLALIAYQYNRIDHNRTAIR
ncbi:MAG: MFS transporter [Mycobacteriaceae bacterium]